jgi:hypothetical protein
MSRPLLSETQIHAALLRELHARGVDCFDLKFTLVGPGSNWRAVVVPGGGRIDEAVAATVYESSALLASGYDLAEVQ